MMAAAEQYGGVPMHTLKGRAGEIWASIIRYCRFSSIHGLVYFVKDNVSRPERIFWLCATLLSIAMLQELVRENVQSYFYAPTETTILDHDLPLWKIRFPALTICPNSNVRPRTGKKIIEAYLMGMAGNGSRVISKTTIMSLLVLMDLYRFPTFSAMKFYVDKLHDILPYFDGLSIAETVYKGSIPKHELLNSTP